MAKTTSLSLPFPWLRRRATLVGLIVLTAIAAFFRFYYLSTLPPGLDETTARLGLQALQLPSSFGLPTLDAANSYAPLWVWLQGLAVAIFGHTTLALRIWPAIIGTLAVLVTWFWLRSWFTPRIAWIGALCLAVSPWAVTASRAGTATALFSLLVPLTLWLGSRALQKPGRTRYAQLGAAIGACLLSGPIGWLFVLTLSALTIWRLRQVHNLMNLKNGRGTGLALAGIGAAALAYFIGTALTAIRNFPQDVGLVPNIAAFGNNVVKVLLMFNVHGDENYRHNLAGYPLLNAFVGLMLVAGLLVAISRLHKLRYRVLLIVGLVLLLPAMFAKTGAPNAAWAAGTTAIIFALVGIGTSWMLDLWYSVFPINSAARAVGQGAIFLLLALTVVQGYTQFFQAWAGSTAVYAAHNEGTAQIAGDIKRLKFDGERFVVLTADQVPVIDYLAYNTPNYRIIRTEEVTALPVGPGKRQFYIGSDARGSTSKVLKAKFPGGVLRPHYSDFNQVEIYYTYEVTK